MEQGLLSQACRGGKSQKKKKLIGSEWMNAEEYCQAPGPAEKASEVSMPNLSASSLSTQNSYNEEHCQRVTHYSQSWEHLIRCIRFVFTRYEVEICGQLQWIGQPWSGPGIAGSQVFCKLKPNLFLLWVTATHLICSTHFYPYIIDSLMQGIYFFLVMTEQRFRV